MTRHLAMRNSLRSFLELKELEVNTAALVRYNEERVKRALGTPSLVPETIIQHCILNSPSRKT
jgi:hypothetical protein